MLWGCSSGCENYRVPGSADCGASGWPKGQHPPNEVDECIGITMSREGFWLGQEVLGCLASYNAIVP